MESRLVKNIEENLRVKTTEDLLAIWKKHDENEWSDEAFEAVYNLLKERGVEVTQHSIPSGHSPADYEELNNYVLKAQGISRSGLNIMCFIGVFIFGWLLAVAFDQLGKKGKGWGYLVPIIFIVAISRQGTAELGVIAPIIYVIGWIHANVVLSRYQSFAKQRIAEIDQTPSSLQSLDVLLERGLLEAKVLHQTDQAMSDFTNVLQQPGGDPQMLNLAGVQLSKAKRFREARQFFDRALETANDQALVKQITKNKASAEKRLK